MNTTRASLLVRVRDSADTVAWSEFHQLYAPLLYRYARSRGLGRADAEDVRDQAMAIVARKIGAFRYNRLRGRFKNWLFRIAHGKVVDLLRHSRVRAVNDQRLQDALGTDLSPQALWETHWRNQHLRFCVDRVRQNVSEQTYQMFCKLLFDGATVDEVCRSCGVNANQVYKAKARVLRLIQNELERLGLDESSP